MAKTELVDSLFKVLVSAGILNTGPSDVRGPSCVRGDDIATFDGMFCIVLICRMLIF